MLQGKEKCFKNLCLSVCYISNIYLCFYLYMLCSNIYLGIAKYVGLWLWMFIFNALKYCLLYTTFLNILKSQCGLPVTSLKIEGFRWFDMRKIHCILEVKAKSGILLKNTFYNHVPSTAIYSLAFYKFLGRKVDWNIFHYFREFKAPKRFPNQKMQLFQIFTMWIMYFRLLKTQIFIVLSILERFKFIY